MYHGARKEQWYHTALLAVMIRNSFCLKRSEAIKIEDIHPYLRKKQKIPMAKNTGDLLIATFCRKACGLSPET
jgi:hypothetical protein